MTWTTLVLILMGWCALSVVAGLFFARLLGQTEAVHLARRGGAPFRDPDSARPDLSLAEPRARVPEARERVRLAG